MQWRRWLWGYAMGLKPPAFAEAPPYFSCSEQLIGLIGKIEVKVKQMWVVFVSVVLMSVILFFALILTFLVLFNNVLNDFSRVISVAC